MFVTISLLLVLLFIWTKLLRKCDNPRTERSIPIPDEYPIIGNFYLLIGFSYILKMWEVARKYSTPYIITLGSHRTVIIDKPNDIQKLQTCSKFDAYKVVAYSDGLVSQIDHSIWKPQRRFLQPLFTTAEVNLLVPIFNKYSKALVKTLNHKVGGNEFNIKKIVGISVVQQTGETLCGIKFNAIEAGIYFHEIETALANGGRDMLLYQFSRPITKYFPLAKLLSHRMKRATQYVKEMLASREDPNAEVYDRKLFLDRVIEMKKNSSILQVNKLDQLGQMLGAAVDTTAVSLSNIILLLAMYPEIQEKCFAEIKALISDGADDDIEPQLTVDMPYLTMTIKECMRVIPTVPFVGKRAVRHIKLDDYDIPAGTDILILFLSLFRSKEIWGEDADEFNPDRFLPELEAKRHKFAYMPFSSGPRNCIGAKYAMVNLQVAVIHLLLNFKFATSLKLKDLVFYGTMTISFIQGHLVTLEKRVLNDNE